MTLPILLPRSEINVGHWDELIAKSGQNVVYAHSWYLDIICDNWKALVWPSADDYQIVMPLPIKRKWGIKVIQQPLFCQYLGLFSVGEISEKQLYLFLEKLSSSFLYIASYHFHPDHSAMLTDVFHRFPKFEIKQKHTYWLALSDTHRAIQFHYSSDRKANLGRAEKFNWTVKASEDIQPLIQLFKDYHATGISGGVSEKAYEILAELFETLKIHNAAELFYAEKEGKINAGTLFAGTGKMVIFLFNSADLLGRKQNARTILLDHYFKLSAKKSLVLDFESPEVKSISSFYQSFGPEPASYYSIRKNDLSFPFKQIQNWRVKNN